MRIILVFVIAMMLPFTTCFSQKKISEHKLLEDFDFAVNELKSFHQGFYNYMNQSETDAAIAGLRNRIAAPMTKLEFYQLMRLLLGLMNEGHGSVDLPVWTVSRIGLSKSFLPLRVNFYGEDLIITQNFGEDIEELKMGAKLVAINGETIPRIMDRLLPLIATDGFNETFKYELVTRMNLALLYRLVYGKSKEFEIQIIDPVSKENRMVKIPAIRFTKVKSKHAKFKSRFFAYSDFKFEPINDSIGYLSILNFGDDDLDYEAFYKKQFRKIDSLNIRHLILDIQANTGGTEGNENLLFSYLSEARIRKYKKVTMLPKPYQLNKDDQNYIFDKWELKDTIAERGDFTLFSDYYSDLGYRLPEKKDIYLNKLYVLTSGLTFSGGAEFASMIKMTNRGKFIGVETGGAYEGNVSGYSKNIKLPNTKIKINIPIVHFQINVLPEERGRGIIPDYVVPQTWTDYLNSKNSKLEFAKKLIMN